MMMFTSCFGGWRFGDFIEWLIDEMTGLFIVVVDGLETFPFMLILHEY